VKNTDLWSLFNKAVLIAPFVFIVFLIASIFRAPVDIAWPLKLTVVPRSELPEKSEPIFCYGHPAEADFLFIKYEGSYARIGFNPWGMPAVYSKSFPWKPGDKLNLTLDMPSLVPFYKNAKLQNVHLVSIVDHTIDYQPAVSSGKLIIKLENLEILNQDVFWHLVRKREIAFGHNLIGGGSCSKFLHGDVIYHGKKVETGSDLNLDLEERYAAWKIYIVPETIYITAVAILVAFVLSFIWLNILFIKYLTLSNIKVLLNKYKAFLISSLICVFLYTWMVTYGDWRIFCPENFGEFYDYQALSLIRGRLDVPLGALNGEAFVYAGHAYGYFGPTPSILRLPFVLLDICFGCLSKIFSITAYASILLMSYILLRRISERFNLFEFKLPNWLVAVFILNVGIGSPIYFLSSRSFIYHEAILWGCVFALMSMYYALYIHIRSKWLNLFLSAFFGLLAHFSRPTLGLAAFGFLCAVVLINLYSEIHVKYKFRNMTTIINFERKLIKFSSTTLAISFICIISLNILSYAKFEDFKILPLKYHLQYSPERLSHFENKLFNVNNIKFNFTTYFLKNKLNITCKFPFIYLAAPKYNDILYGAKMDVIETTEPLYNSMPILFTTSIIGLIYYLLFFKKLRFFVLAIIFGALPLFLSLLTASSVSNRYTVDYLPTMIISSILGLICISKYISNIRYMKSALILFSVIIIIINMNITLNYQRAVVWGVDNKYRIEYNTLLNHLNIKLR